MGENRKEHRFKAVLPIRIIYAGNEISGCTDNLSRLGTYAEIDREIPTGENVDVILVLPAYSQNSFLTEEVKCKGNIFRSVFLRQTPTNKYYGVGIFFVDFSGQEHREKLSDFVEHLILKEEQEIKGGLKRRKEKDQAQKLVKHSEEFYALEEEFRKESLNMLYKISSQLEEISRLLQAEHKKQ